MATTASKAPPVSKIRTLKAVPKTTKKIKAKVSTEETNDEV